MRNLFAILSILCIILQNAPSAGAQPSAAPAALYTVLPPTVPDPDGNFNPGALRGGGYRSPRSGYTDGNRARNPGVNNPVNRTPAAPGSRFGGFFGGMFGGLLAGSLLGSLFNPFGFGGAPGGISILGLVFWGVILYIVYRLFRRVMGRGR